MELKDTVRARLSQTEVMEGVLPTPARASTGLREVARLFRTRDFPAAVSMARDQLEKSEVQYSLETALPLFSGTPGLQEQLAGFADAGINFFYADQKLLELPLEERRTRGASGAVSRVMISRQRVLLETPRVIIRFKQGIGPDSRKAILAKHNVADIESGGLPPDTIKGAVLQGTAVDCSLALMQDENVVYAEPDFLEHIGHRYTPSDPDYGKQWHHKNIRADDAWDVTKGNGVSIAVVDNGFDIHHPELRFGALSGHFQSTPDHLDAEFVPGTAGMPDEDHGTACAGMIAAAANNQKGGCGVAFDATLNMIACVTDQIGTQSTLARAIAYAATPNLEDSSKSAGDGADVISCSLGPSSSAVWELRQVLSDALDFAATQGRGGKGCAIFWACTNGNFPIGSDQVCSHPRVAAVGRSRKDNQHDASGFGPQLEFLAPGVDVWIPASGGGYQKTTGTSFAAPCATAVAGLALSQNPNLTFDQVRQLMRDSCEKVGTLPYVNGRNVRYGYGRVNAARAVAAARDSLPQVAAAHI